MVINFLEAMQLKVLLKKISFVFFVGRIVLFSIIIFFLVFGPPVQAASVKSTVPVGSQIGPGLPIRLKIPKIKVDAAVEAVGITSDGAVGVPKKPTNVAWFKLGPRPGDLGSAVVTGHYGPWKDRAPTVFNNLYKLRKGDKVYVKDGKGVTITFVVRELRTYRENEEAPDVFNLNDGKAHLNLITCQGVWNKNRKSYSERLVVFTDRE